MMPSNKLYDTIINVYFLMGYIDENKQTRQYLKLDCCLCDNTPEHTILIVYGDRRIEYLVCNEHFKREFYWALDLKKLSEFVDDEIITNIIRQLTEHTTVNRFANRPLVKDIDIIMKHHIKFIGIPDQGSFKVSSDF